MNATIDLEAIRAAANLRQVVEADLGQPLRGGRWACPFHGGENPNLAITPDGRHWKCWSCAESGDVFDWLMKRDGLTFVQAARQLGGLEEPSRKPARKTTAAPTTDRTPCPIRHAWEDPAWQTTVDAIVAQAESALWSSEGRTALDWLRSRGLVDHTIVRFRLGFNPADYRTDPLEVLGTDGQGRPRFILVRRGITIPWLRPGSWYSAVDDDFDEPGPRWVGCNVRRLASDPFAPLPDGQAKCLALGGSTRGHLYPHPTIEPVGDPMPALILEGEIDALLGWQEVGHLVHAGTVGGSQQTPQRSALVALGRCPWWLLAFDHDGPGVEAARAWKARNRNKARRLLLPHGKDLGDFAAAGGDVRQWLLDEAVRFSGDHHPEITPCG